MIGSFTGEIMEMRLMRNAWMDLNDKCRDRVILPLWKVQ